MGNKGSSLAKGVCGKEAATAELQDLLIHTLKGISAWAVQAGTRGISTDRLDDAVMDGLFATITNANTLTFTDTYVPSGTHEYWICSLFNNPMMLSEPSNVVTVNIGVSNDDQIAPPVSVGVYPNPFNDRSTFEISAKAAQDLKLSIYNLKGQLVKSWSAHTDISGNLSIEWDGTDASGNTVNSGVYYYKVQSKDLNMQGKLIRM